MIILCSEYDRNYNRNVPIGIKDYYGRGRYESAPLNVFVGMNLRDKKDGEPFPDIDHNFPNHHLFKDNYELILDEVMHLYNNGYMTKIKGDQLN